MWKIRTLMGLHVITFFAFGFDQAAYAFTPALPQRIYDANEIISMHILEDRQILCRSNGSVEIYTDSFGKRVIAFSTENTSGPKKMFFFEEYNRVAKMIETERGKEVFLYDLESGIKKEQVPLRSIWIYDLKLRNEQLHYLCAEGYYIYDFQGKAHLKHEIFPSFPKAVETAMFGTDDIRYFLFGKMQISGINANNPVWQTALDADTYSVEKHPVQPGWPYCLLYYDPLGTNASRFDCISLENGKTVWQRTASLYGELRGISINGQYQAWFNQGQLTITRFPSEDKTLRIASISEEADVLFDLGTMKAFCLPSIKMISEDRKNNRWLLGRSSHVLKVIDLNSGELLHEISL